MNKFHGTIEELQDEVSSTGIQRHTFASLCFACSYALACCRAMRKSGSGSQHPKQVRLLPGMQNIRKGGGRRSAKSSEIVYAPGQRQYSAGIDSAPIPVPFPLRQGNGIPR